MEVFNLQSTLRPKFRKLLLEVPEHQGIHILGSHIWHQTNGKLSCHEMRRNYIKYPIELLLTRYTSGLEENYD
jgi:hypothetical protein